LSFVANETTKRLIARVKQIRKARRLTQEQFAELADLDPKYYQHAEAGRKPNPEMETLLKLAKGTGYQLWQLLNFDAELPILAEDKANYGAKTSPAKSASKPPKRRPPSK
jgi:transcriptional regulator with XRE-family HTH domain